MAVRLLDASSLSEVMPGLYEVVSRCYAEENAEEPCRSPAEVEGFLRHVPSVETRDYWIAESKGECVGFATLAVMRDSPTGRVELLVHPEHRRLGYGSALLDVVREQATKRGARRLASRHATGAGSSFAALVGAADTFREVRSLLRLPLPEDLRPRPVDGYSLRSWVGAAPEELLDSFARARDAINDAPGFGEEREVWTAARIRDLEAAVARRDRDVRVTVALDARGEVVAFSELRISQAPGSVAGTEDTATAATHRRRGLGRWVKLESLHRLQRDRPDATLVSTSNAEENDAMLGLNRSLGFFPVTVYTNCTLEIGG
jgi:mycothiol synthase